MPKKGERMPASQRAKIAQATKARNAAIRASQPAAEEPKLETVGGIAVEVAASQPASAPKSLLDSVLGSIKANPSTSAQGGASKEKTASEDNFLFALVPVASGFLAYYSGSLWADEYKGCAPSKAEVSAVLTPVTRILARRLDIQLKETPDIRDLRLAGTALLLYVVRSAMMAIEIQEQEEKTKAVAYAQHLTTKGAYPGRETASAWDGRAGTNQGASSGTVGGGASAVRDREKQLRYEQSGLASGGVETDAEFARRAIAEAFEQDKLYRTQNGLL